MTGFTLFFFFFPNVWNFLKAKTIKQKTLKLVDTVNPHHKANDANFIKQSKR